MTPEPLKWSSDQGILTRTWESPVLIIKSILRKLLFFIFALVALGVAFFSYSKYYARKDVTKMLNEARLSASVKTALALNRHLKDTNIDVAASDGTITLSGAVGTAIQRQLAEEIASSISGVDKCQNNLSINALLNQMPPNSERTLGQKLDDLTVEASIKTALLLNENVRGRSIRVSSYKGNVTLTGSVDSLAELELARKIAVDVDGVASVENKLEVNGVRTIANDTVTQKLNDATIEAQVRAALMVNRNIDSTEIEVKSRNAIVTLTGMVHSGAEKELVEKIAEGCWGVKGVINEIRIKQEQK
jgi:osmotically-inducible protein OsmY